MNSNTQDNIGGFMVQKTRKMKNQIQPNKSPNMPSVKNQVKNMNFVQKPLQKSQLPLQQEVAKSGVTTQKTFQKPNHVQTNNNNNNFQTRNATKTNVNNANNANANNANANPTPQRARGPSKRIPNEVKNEVELTLPLIFKTDIPDKLKLAMLDKLQELIIVKAPTGYGKTVLVNYLLALTNQLLAKEGENVTCVSLMPFRISVKEMHKYLLKLFPTLNFGYAMRGDSKVSPANNCRLMTVGYWLEQFLSKFRENGLPKERMIVMVDEAHDASWQTDLALRILLWAQAQGAPIKIIISSATLDITQTLKMFKGEPLILSEETKEANVDIVFLDEPVQFEHKGKLSDQILVKMLKTLESIYSKNNSGDCLCMLPGQDEIDKFIQLVEKHPMFKDFAICPLYSQLSSDEIQLAISPDSEGRIKIIVCTNIVENAITISGIDFVVDCGGRKANSVDENGVQQLVFMHASQSNLKQCLGRVGRLGKRGTAFLMMTKFEFDCRRPYAENEVHNNPLYLQIIKLVRDNLPVNEVLSHVSLHRIEKDTQFLIRHGALEHTEKGIVVTELGKIMSHLPLSIRASHFLAYVMKNVSSSFWYTACIISAWIDTTSSIFFRPGRKSREPLEDYEARLEQAKEIQSKFYEKDCVGTMLNVFYSSWTFPKEQKGGFHGWCKDNGIFDRTLKEMNNEINHTIDALGGLGFVVNTPNTVDCGIILGDLNSMISGLIAAMEKAFNDWIFNPSRYTEFTPENTYSCEKYAIDKSVDNATIHGGDRYKRIIALNLRRVNPRFIVLSKIIEIPIPEKNLMNFDYDPDGLVNF